MYIYIYIYIYPHFNSHTQLYTPVDLSHSTARSTW